LLTHVAVPRLGREAVAELLATYARAADAVEAAVEDVYAITEGNPLFVGEVLRNLAEGTTLAAAPATLYDLIVARFERLSPPARELAGIAATIGEAFDVDVLRETSSWNEPALLEAIDELQDRSIVREPVGRHRFDYAFTHQLVQRTIYASSSPEARKRRHRRIARVMEDLFASRLDVAAADIARHHECGGNVAKAAERYVHAARAATAVFATDEALAHARKAASLAGEDGALRFSALAIAELMDDRLCDRDAQRTDLEELETLARASGDHAQICHILWRRVGFCRACGDRDAEYAAALELKAQALSAGDPRWLGVAFEAEGTYFELIGNPAAALILARQAAEQFDAAGDGSGLVSALTLQASPAVYVGEIEEADGCIVRARDVAQSALNPILSMRVLRCEANVCHWRERWRRHDDVLHEALALARSVGDRETEATCLGQVALSGLRFARFREARTDFAESAAMFQAIEKPQGLATVSLNASALESEAGLWERALALLDRAERLALQCNWRYGEGICHINRGLVFQYREDFLTARNCSDKARALAIEVNNERLLGMALRDRGVAVMGLGDAPAAVADLLDACRLFERCSAPEPLLEAKAELAKAYWSAGERGPAVALALDLTLAHEGDATATRFAPFRTAWAAALILRRAGEQSAVQILQRSYGLLVDRRDAYEDEESRVAFMRIPIHERIVAAYERDEWPMP
jgi:tetratricopeptide (TPR) repeat protein